MLKTFDQLDQEAGADALFTDYAAKPVRPDSAGYQTPDALVKAKEIADRSVFAAAFRQDNTVGSLLSRKDMGVDNLDDGKYDPVAYIKEHKLEAYEPTFYGILNTTRADAIRSQIEMEARDKETLAVSGWAGTFAQVAAGFFDVPTLIPGTVAVRGAKGGYAVGKSVLMGGVSAGAAQAVTEGFLQSTQQTRTAGESYANIGASVIIGSLIGGGVAAVLKKNDHITMTRALEQIDAINSGKVPNTFVPSALADGQAPRGVGADVAEGAFYVDPVQAPRTRAEQDVAGKLATGAVEATSWLNPMLRGTQRYAASARQFTANIYENTIYKTMHGEGGTTGVSVEAIARTKVEAREAAAVKIAESEYSAMRKAGIKLSRDDFYDQVGVAMRNDDMSDNAFVNKVAKAYRKEFDAFTQEALSTARADGKPLLEVADLDVKTALSYFSRVPRKDKLLAEQPQFLAEVGAHIRNQMERAHAEDAAQVATAQAKYKTRIADTSLSGPERSARIDDIKAQGAKLDADNAQLNDIVDALTEKRGALRGSTGEAKTAIQKEIADLKTQGGPELEAYLAQRAELRARLRNLTERNPDAQTARADKMAEQIDRIQEGAEKSLTAYSRQMKNVINKIDSDPVGAARDAIAITERHISDIEKKLAKGQERVSKLSGDPAAAKVLADEQQRLFALEVKFTDLVERLGQRDTAVDAARELLTELDNLGQRVTASQAKRTLRRGEKLAEVKARAANLTPEAVAARASAQQEQYGKVLGDIEERKLARWQEADALGREKGEPARFQAAAERAALEIWEKWTGQGNWSKDAAPHFTTSVATGPLRERTVMIPDAVFQRNGWLVNDVRQVFGRYSRAMAGDIETTRRFGSPKMETQLAKVGEEYNEMRAAIGKATTPAEVNAVLGRDKFKDKADLAQAKAEAQMLLNADEKSAIVDMKAGRDIVRGSYMVAENSGSFGTISRLATGMNYLVRMGGVLLANVSEFYRPAMVHGLGPYLNTLPSAMAQAFNAGGAGIKLSIKEANLAGLVVERTRNALTAVNADLADPFVQSGTYLERLMRKGTSAASRWNLINMFTDAQQTIASTVSQHRIMEAVLGNGGKDGSFVKGDGTRLIRMLGIDDKTQADIARYVTTHGDTVDGIRVANTEKWLSAANASGNAQEIARAERAVWTYRTALNTDVNSIVSRKGAGDAPLFAHTPLGRMMLQFSGYAMGAHSRVMIRGLQEDQARFVGGLVMMSALGGVAGWIASYRQLDQEQAQKKRDEWVKNPASFAGEAIDRSGLFPLMFDFSNRVEKIAGAVGYSYRFNPIKSPITKAGGGDFFGGESSRASSVSGVYSGVLGPTAGLAEGALAAARVGADKLAGKEPPKRDKAQALATIPFQSYYVVREILQLLNR